MRPAMLTDTALEEVLARLEAIEKLLVDLAEDLADLRAEIDHLALGS